MGSTFRSLSSATTRARSRIRIVEKSGAWFAYAGERLGQGRENAKQFLKDNTDIRRAIDERVRKELGLTREADVVAIA